MTLRPVGATGRPGLRWTHREAADALVLVAAKALLGLWVLRLGFTHVSDDDYARVVIAQLFAHAPRLDPSGTSWLPAPFWALGGAMLVFGRSLATARAVAIALGCAGAALVYAALRQADVARGPALLGAAVGMATPWAAWLGVATVPEAPTASLIACGAILAAQPRARLHGALGLFVAALSRYEAWPVCVVAAFACAWAARPGGARGDERAQPRESRGLLLATACLALAGPLLWMLWNAHAHDGPLHFLRRVTAFHAAAARASGSPVVLSPEAIAASAPDIVLIAVAGSFGLVDPALRRRWAWPLAGALGVVAFLLVGEAGGGAPTHHFERTLLPVFVLLGAFGADGVWTVARRGAWGRPRREAWLAAGTVTTVLAWGFTIERRLAAAPGEGPGEDRTEQVARGRAIAASGAASLEVTPCAYEHFALLAAYGAPENARTMPARPAPECPDVIVR